jgi:ATP adenylyltransferase
VINPNVGLPFKYFAVALPPSSSATQIHKLYLQLYSAAVQAVQDVKPKAVSHTLGASVNAATISYNLAMTQRALVLCPRLDEGSDILDADGNVLGFVALNGTILGGTLLVKSEAEFNAFSNDYDEKLNLLLTAIGVPES